MGVDLSGSGRVRDRGALDERARHDEVGLAVDGLACGEGEPCADLVDQPEGPVVQAGAQP